MVPLLLLPRQSLSLLSRATLSSYYLPFLAHTLSRFPGSSCPGPRLLRLPPPPLVGSFGVKGKLARPAGQGRRKAGRGSHGHDAPTARAREEGGVESGGGKGSRPALLLVSHDPPLPCGAERAGGLTLARRFIRHSARQLDPVWSFLAGRPLATSHWVVKWAPL